jgi:hypothetical protein
MYEVVTKLEGGKVIIDVQNVGKSVEGLRKEFPINGPKKDWQAWHKYCLREASSRNTKEKRKAAPTQ